ncbi:MAG: hypothetical protein JW751_04075 [Polyangiaceae bacterium]|nr:hypothetical protein [Polyangiaceae bacterium]
MASGPLSFVGWVAPPSTKGQPHKVTPAANILRAASRHAVLRRRSPPNLPYYRTSNDGASEFIAGFGRPQLETVIGAM